MRLFSFDTSSKHQKASGFLMFQGLLKETSDMKWVHENSTVISSQMLFQEASHITLIFKK